MEWTIVFAESPAKTLRYHTKSTSKWLEYQELDLIS
jgi:hypothetical protein